MTGGHGGNGKADAHGHPGLQRTGAITTVHRYELPLPCESVWTLIGQVQGYRSWWPWLRQFEGEGLEVGDEWRCTVQPPVPYLVRFRVVIDHVEAPTLVRARVLGDVVGDATLTLEASEVTGPGSNGDGRSDGTAGCVARLESSLAPGNRALAVVSRFAAPVARFGHDWVLDSAARQFIARAVEPALGGHSS
jgi:uncharacterized protein YndB with AHSA1/START domain